MSKIEKLHSQNHGLYTSYSVKNKEGKFETVTSVKAAAEITEQIAIEFLDFIGDNDSLFEKWATNRKSSKELFQEFLKTKQ